MDLPNSKVGPPRPTAVPLHRPECLGDGSIVLGIALEFLLLSSFLFQTLRRHHDERGFYNTVMPAGLGRSTGDNSCDEAFVPGRPVLCHAALEWRGAGRKVRAGTTTLFEVTTTVQPILVLVAEFSDKGTGADTPGYTSMSPHLGMLLGVHESQRRVLEGNCLGGQDHASRCRPGRGGRRRMVELQLLDLAAFRYLQQSDSWPLNSGVPSCHHAVTETELVAGPSATRSRDKASQHHTGESSTLRHEHVDAAHTMQGHCGRRKGSDRASP